MDNKACHGDTPNRDDGFTLIEIMVVVLIIGILLAIAIPTFIGARNRANDRAAEANLKNALTAELVLYLNGQSATPTYADTSTVAGQSVLSAFEPSLAWVTPSTSYAHNAVSATVVQPGEVVVADQSPTGICFYAGHVDPPGTPAGTLYALSSASPCTQPSFPPATIPPNGAVAANGSWGWSF